MNKHFFKTLFIFMGMIVLGVMGVLLLDHFDKKAQIEATPEKTVAK